MALAYGKKVDKLRKRYKDYLWYAKFHDTIGAKVTANGGCRYSVFDAKDRKRAVVVINMENNRPITAIVKLPHARKLVVATPEHQEALPTTGRMRIPAQSAAVIMEQ